MGHGLAGGEDADGRQEIETTEEMTKKKPVSTKNKKRGPQRSAMRQAADAAGLSRSAMYNAIALANIPEDYFEELIESDNPPTMPELILIGKSKKPPLPKTPLERALDAVARLSDEDWNQLLETMRKQSVSPSNR